MCTATMERILECELCMESYDSRKRIPKSLPCGHGSCSICLTSMIKNSIITCHQCRNQYSIPQGQIAKLPTNFVILELLDNACGECKKNPHSTRCQQCGLQLCHPCASTHDTSIKCDVISKISQLQDLVAKVNDPGRNEKVLQEIRDKGQAAARDATKAHHDRISGLEQVYRHQINEIKAKAEEDLKMHKKWQETIKGLSDKAKNLRTNASVALSQESTADTTLKQIQQNSAKLLETISDAEMDKPDVTMIELPDVKDNFDSLLSQLRTIHMSVEVRQSFAGAFAGCKVVSNYEQAKCSKTVGNWGTGAMEYRGAKGLCVTEKSNLVAVVDSLNDKLEILNADLEFLCVVKIQNPFGVCSHDGQIFVTQSGKNQIMVVTENGEFVRSITSTNGVELNNPRGIAKDRRGRMFVCNAGDSTIKVIEPSGKPLKTFGQGKFPSRPCYITIASNDKVYISDEAGNLHIFRTDGAFIRTLPASTEPNNLRLTGVASDAQSRVLASDSSGRILVLDDSGRVLATIGAQSGPGGARGGAQKTLSGPQGLAVTNNGDILVADGKNNTVIKFSVPRVDVVSL